ncbi:MAG TPA: porin family protein, partial [Chitinophagales bacterium]|nr:porin family protein [Chitinophagales bacterium]
ISHLRKFSTPTDYKKRANLGSDLAAFLRIDFNKYVGLQTEVEFIQKGQRWNRTLDSAKFTSKSVLNYIQFPILAVGRVGNEKVKGVFLFGPYFAYWSGAYTQDAVSVDKQTTTATTNKYNFTSQDMRFDVGIVTGAGVDIKAGKKGWIEFTARHNAGLLSTSKKNAGTPKLYNCSFNLSLGYIYVIK